MSWVRLFLLALAFDQVATAAAQTGGPIQLNEVLADPPPDLVGDANGDGVRDSGDDEFIELVNIGTAPIDIAGWSLSDSTEVRHAFPSDVPFLVPPGETVTVFGGGEPTGIGGLVLVASSGKLALNNGGDTVTLSDRGGVEVDRHHFGSEGGRDVSLSRVPDGRGDWVPSGAEGSTAPFSPGRWNQGITPALPLSWGAMKASTAR